MPRPKTLRRRLIGAGAVVAVLAIAHVGLSYWLYELDDVL